MGRRSAIGFVAGVAGGVILVLLMAVDEATTGHSPSFVAVYQATLRPGASVLVSWTAGGVLFCLTAGLWGALFGVFVTAPSVAKGLAFGFLPALCTWLVVAPAVLGQPLFFGYQPMMIVRTLAYDVLWGAYVGWHTGRYAYAQTAML